MNADGSSVRQVTHDDSDSIHPSWAPDGRYTKSTRSHRRGPTANN
jgi:Tol biopolymer transport system component